MCTLFLRVSKKKLLNPYLVNYSKQGLGFVNLIWNQFCYFSLTCIAEGIHFQQPLKKIGSNSSTGVQIYSSNVYLEHFYHFTRVIIFALENVFNFLAVISLYKSKSSSILAKTFQRRKKTPPFNNVSFFHIFNWSRKYLLGSWKSAWKKYTVHQSHWDKKWTRKRSE